MASTSPRQKRFMRIAAHSKAFAAKAEIPQSVAREFYQSDKRKARRGAIRKAIDKVKSG